MKAWRVEVWQGPAGQAKWLEYGLSAIKSETSGLQQRGGPEPRRAGFALEAVCPYEPGA